MTDIDIGISEKNRESINTGLQKLLADTYILYFKTHSYHWNVTGPLFNTLHLMFQTQYNELWLSIDLIAERIRSLGFYAPSSSHHLGKLTSIHEEGGVPVAEDMIRHLVSGHETVIKTARTLLPVADEGGDEVTLDLLTQRLEIHEKTAWMLRSMLVVEKST
ncbi:Dps family protein [Leptospira barantonii]|uniref:DNA starvation/stationary phase protection protein n=1 Tax=Leptospira barantonii TaxID=2023184 RepID=A0ABX4NIA2_9LEPT|nr:Dps family protein [Leptospira barantonii]PJZ55716.1 DNA starvation/stationary phase protection protein [Leptospira barantonii]